MGVRRYGLRLGVELIWVKARGRVGDKVRLRLVYALSSSPCRWRGAYINATDNNVTNNTRADHELEDGCKVRGREGLRLGLG